MAGAARHGKAGSGYDCALWRAPRVCVHAHATQHAHEPRRASASAPPETCARSTPR